MMTEGTKSVLYGAHSFMHTMGVIRSWKHLYGVWPSWRACVCIILHDIGYWGTEYLSEKSNAGHAERGAKIATVLFTDPAWGKLILGHSASACLKFGITPSRLEPPDDYSWIIAPAWWLRWNIKVEKFGVDPEVWREAVRSNFYAEHKLSGTELCNKLRDSNT